MSARLTPESVSLPPRPFLYTFDQIATILSMEIEKVFQYTYFDGRTTGRREVWMFMAHNIARPQDEPEWRIQERELIRWMKVKGFRFYERTW